MDVKKVFQDPRYRLVFALVIGALVGAVGRLLRHHTSPEPAPFNWLVEMERRGFPPPMMVAVGLWIIPGVYWEFAARNATKVKEPFRTRSVHLFLTSAAQLLVLVPIPGLRERFLPLAAPIWIAGLVIEVLAVALTVWSRAVLGKNWSGAIATNVDHELIRRGPYRHVRHPIYTGIIGTYLGITLVSGELHALLGLALVLVAYARKIRMEEAHLHEAFGPAYADYAQDSWRLIPRIY